VAKRLVGLESDLDDARPELSVQVDRERAALYGLNTTEVGMAVRGAIQGVEAAKYRTGNDEYDIVVRLAEPYRNELWTPWRSSRWWPTGARRFPSSRWRTWEVQEGGDRSAGRTWTGWPPSRRGAGGFNQNAVLAEVQATLAEFPGALPPGTSSATPGSSRTRTSPGLPGNMAFGIALLLIAFILISQFNSVVKPVIILTSVIMSTVGVLLGLMVFSMPFVIIMTGVGIISLAGIVVNNAIVLIDYIDILRERDGMNRREALVQGGMTRFRPVSSPPSPRRWGWCPWPSG
jgi:multidrug efflux pump